MTIYEALVIVLVLVNIYSYNRIRDLSKAICTTEDDIVKTRKLCNTNFITIAETLRKLLAESEAKNDKV